MDISDTEEIARHPRSIVHLDIDCFYAQVEMLRHPELDGKPLGVQQKNIVVTSNYLARKFGVGKCMSVQEALRLCPGLSLIRGEDLSEYRRISTKISEILHQFTPLVERLGMDESFVDVSSMVERYENDKRDTDCRMKDGNSCDDDYDDCEDKPEQVVGNIFGMSEEECPCGCHARLAAASRIAADMRARIYKELHLTCSAGIGTNKLVAKLAGSLHKPNQQTVVYPCSGPALLTKIGPVSKIPGVGFKTDQLLAMNNIRTVEDMRRLSLEDLELKIGSDLARKLKDSAEGIDDSAVKPSGKPQSIGIEDGFKHVSLVVEVESRLGALLRRLTDLATEDGRIPVAMKVTVRKHDLNKPSTGKRETRQCALPQTLLPSTKGGIYDHGKMLILAMKLFHRAVDVSKPFHLTLLGVAFTKFEERVSGRSSITSFLRKQVAVQSVLDISSEEGISELDFPSAGSNDTSTIPDVAISTVANATTATATTTVVSDVLLAVDSRDSGDEMTKCCSTPSPDRMITPPLNLHSPSMSSSSAEATSGGNSHNYLPNHRPHRHHHHRHLPRHHHHHHHRRQSPEEEDSSGEVEPSPKKTKLEVWLRGRRESPSNEMASLRLSPSSPMSSISPPPGTDPAVFKSLPIDLQTEISQSWSTSSKPKPNDILKYFIANK
ncbi:DNA polymerase iota [Neodiprion pinetum]|uniref:DNA polymerase iota n=1 Tax=Neodiprion pinetum TaxID=441929 RepID=UPI001EE00AA2|nr:DNA polymerase iota [Neodiprion pinetum]